MIVNEKYSMFENVGIEPVGYKFLILSIESKEDWYDFLDNYWSSYEDSLKAIMDFNKKKKEAITISYSEFSKSFNWDIKEALESTYLETTTEKELNRVKKYLGSKKISIKVLYEGFKKNTLLEVLNSKPQQTSSSKNDLYLLCS